MSQQRVFNFEDGRANDSVVGLDGVEVNLPDTAPTEVKIEYSNCSDSGHLTFVPSPDPQNEPHSLIYQIPPDQSIKEFSVNGSGLSLQAPPLHQFHTLNVETVGRSSNMGKVRSQIVKLSTTGSQTDATGLTCEVLHATSTGGALLAPAADEVSITNVGSQLSAAVSDSRTARFSLSNVGGTAKVEVPQNFDGKFSGMAMVGAISVNGEKLPQSYERPAMGDR